ncbi:hypothetical protein E1A91_A05G345400v1 [Gossypium mustelinum]|uniref:Uncharacterized protein n=1 Tax=Gossypium mustelinum TaxID=34275 RepID=A0A5D2ZFP1_GOSMU|nr:hypothetical protein E1A91_A05G345400v1 [Gossypium mustelinum]
MARLFFHTPKFGILDVCTNATSVNVEEQLYILAKDLGITVITSSQELEKYSDDNKELAWMFFVDGCVILQAVYIRYGNDDDNERKWRKIHECNPKVHRRYCYQPRRGQGNRLFKEGKFELAREKYENVSNVMLDMFTSRKIKSEMFEGILCIGFLKRSRQQKEITREQAVQDLEELERRREELEQLLLAERV